jgi:HPt (histidine-containing phosphotransfer) domain-containing protein
MDLKIPEPKHQAVNAFLQQTAAASVDPLDPTYKFHSHGIITTLDDLLVEFRQKKKDADDEWAKAEKVFKDSIKALEDFLTKNQLAMDALKANILKLKGEIAAARIDLVNAEAMLKDDQLYMKDLTVRCEARANDWDQRSQLRNDEIEAITGALKILTDDVSVADTAVNERALLQSRASAVKSVHHSAKGALSFLQTRNVESAAVRAHVKLSTQARQDMVAALLGGEGKRIGSVALTTLAMRMAGDPFTKIKTLIQDLIQRLLDEATAEATKKRFL